MKIQLVNNSLLRLSAILLLACAWVNVSAEPEAPPVFCVDDDCVNTPDDPGPGGNYTLASIGSVPFAYSTPALPRITSEATVTPSTIAANKVNGRRIVLQAGSYGEQTFNTQDQEIVFTPGANISLLNVGSAARRLRFTANPIRSGSIGYIMASGAQDLTFDGITQSHVSLGGSYPIQRNDFVVQRLAILNSSFLARDFVFLSYSEPNNRLTDVVIANNNMVDGGTSLGGSGSGQAALRAVGAARFVFVDNRLVGNASDGYQNFRIHAQPNLKAEYFYIARNQFEGSGHSFQRSAESGSPTSAQVIENVYYVNNLQYCNFQPPINVQGTSGYWPTSLTVTGNTLYSSAGGYPSNPSGYSWVVASNSTSGYQAPRSWSFK